METSNYNISGGQIGAVGTGAQASNFTQQQFVQGMDPQAFSEALTVLLTEAKSNVSEPDHHLEVGKLAAAQAQASSGHIDKALGILKGVGKWTVDLAVKIGSPLVSAYLKNYFNLP